MTAGKRILHLLGSLAIIISVSLSALSACADLDTSDAAEEESIPVIYDGDEVINLFINRYNSVNGGNEITKEEIKPYNHHGSNHKNQVTVNPSKTVITSLAASTVQVSLQYDSQETFKEYFAKYARAFNENLSDNQIEKYWEAIMAEETSYLELKDFDIYVRKNYFEDGNPLELLQLSADIDIDTEEEIE